MGGLSGFLFLDRAIEIMCTTGLAAWFMTDCHSTIVLGSEIDFADSWRKGEYGVRGPAGTEAFAFLYLNRLINLMHEVKGLPVPGPDEERHPWFRFEPHQSEVGLLEMIRSGNYSRIEVTARDGTIDRIKTTANLGNVADQIDSILREHKYQTVSVAMKDGRVVNVIQEISQKPTSGHAAARTERG